MSTPPGPPAPGRKRKRGSWSLSPENHEMVSHEARRTGISDNAMLNVLLTELREWRSGQRRFHESAKAAAGAR